MQTMRRIGVQINGKLVGSCDSISKVSSPLFKDILDPWIDIKGFVPEKPSLNENQQVVLDYLKNIYSDVYEDCSPLETMYLFGGRRAWSEESNLTDKEEFQVLAAFAEWGMKEVAE